MSTGGPGGLALYEQTKRRHLDTALQCANQGITFVPMVAEPTGAWGPVALKTFAALSKTAAAESGSTPGTTLAQLLVLHSRRALSKHSRLNPLLATSLGRPDGMARRA